MRHWRKATFEAGQVRAEVVYTRHLTLMARAARAEIEVPSPVTVTAGAPPEATVPVARLLPVGAYYAVYAPKVWMN